MSAVPEWTGRRMCVFDLETTSPEPLEARIVTAAVAFVGGGEETATVTWLADPGVEIPDEAAEIHGITTEKARADGSPAEEVIGEVLARLRAAVAEGMPLVIFNARYDLSVLACEALRHGLDMITDFLVIDPLVIDKHLDQYRKSLLWGEDGPSSRTLEGMCRHYGAVLDGAHDAGADAVAAGRLAWVLGVKGRVVRRVRNGREAVELRELEQEWAAARQTLEGLHDAQQRWARGERERFATYKESQGEPDLAAKIRSEDWPLIPMPVAA